MESKSALRRIVRDRGELYDGRTRAAMSQRVMEAVGRFPPFADAASVALYWSLPAEVDTHAFVEKWAVRKKVYLPVMRGDGLSLRKFTGRNELREARFGIREPVGEEETCLRRIDLIVVPAMGYDPYGNRLGHGKGFYDRLLTCEGPLKIGVSNPSFSSMFPPMRTTCRSIGSYAGRNGRRAGTGTALYGLYNSFVSREIRKPFAKIRYLCIRYAVEKT